MLIVTAGTFALAPTLWTSSSIALAVTFVPAPVDKRVHMYKNAHMRTVDHRIKTHRRGNRVAYAVWA